MLVTLKDTTFDEADYGCLDIGGGRYLAYDAEDDDYHVSTKPVVIRSKPIQVGGSVEEIRAFAVDRPNSVDFLLVGFLFRSPATGFAWIAGDLVGDVLQEGGSNNDRLFLPPLLFRYPKEKPSNMSKNQLLSQIAAEAEIRTRRRLRRFWLPCPEEELELHRFIHPDSRDEDEQVEGHNMKVEAQNLNSSLGKCAKTCNCSRCQRIRRFRLLLRTKMELRKKSKASDEDEQVEAHNLNFPFGKCPKKCNCSKCQRLIRLLDRQILFGKFIRDEDEQVEGHNMAHNLNSSNVWSMEQLNLSLGK